MGVSDHDDSSAVRALLDPSTPHLVRWFNYSSDLSCQDLIPGEWRLDPQTVLRIWNIVTKVNMDLFGSTETSHCSLCEAQFLNMLCPVQALCIVVDNPTSSDCLQGHTRGIINAISLTCTSQGQQYPVGVKPTSWEAWHPPGHGQIVSPFRRGWKRVLIIQSPTTIPAATFELQVRLSNHYCPRAW